MRQTLQNQTDRNISGTNDRNDFVKIRNSCTGSKVIHNDSDRNVESSIKVLVGLVAQDLQRLCIEDIHIVVKGSVGITDI